MRDPLDNISYAKPDNIGEVVMTAGEINLDLEDQNVQYNCGEQRLLPTGYMAVLKDIDQDGMAYIYHHINGVMKMPAVLLMPVRGNNGLRSGKITVSGAPSAGSRYH
jgi:hypothetical protein